MVTLTVEFERRRWLRGGSFRGPAEARIVGRGTFLVEFAHRGVKYRALLRRCARCPERWRVGVDGEEYCEAELCADFLEDLLKGSTSLRVEIFESLMGRAEALGPLAEDATNPHALYAFSGVRVVVKGYRLARGWNPEPLFLRYLSGTGFAPRAYATYGDGGSYLGVVVEFVEGHDPGRNVYASALSCARGEDCSVPREVEAVARALANFHSRMLACEESWCKPSISGHGDVARWVKRIETYGSLIEGHGLMTEQLRALVGLSRSSIERMKGCTILRTHQDFHFSQTLVTPEGRVLIVDFEGEPARPEWAARDLEPAVRDLATLLRALSYISFFSVAEALATDPAGVVSAARRSDPAVERVREWGLAAAERAASAYAAGAPRGVLPDKSPGGILEVAMPWFIERALYEAVYELEYRRELAQVALGTLELGLPPLTSAA